MNKISKIFKNSMGTASIIAKFTGMRKEQDFCFYPLQGSVESVERVQIQSDTRIGYLYFKTGNIELCPPVSSGAYNPHLRLVKHVDTLSTDELNKVKDYLRGTASSKAGSNGLVYTDNSGASLIK